MSLELTRIAAMPESSAPFAEAFTKDLLAAVALNKEHVLIGRPPRLPTKKPDTEPPPPPPRWDKVQLRRAKEEDAAFLPGWVQNDNERIWLGGHTCASDEFGEWISQSLAAFILLYPDSSGHLKEVAFANITYVSSSSTSHHLEIGRLIVDPANRGRGFGTSFLNHLVRTAVDVLSTLNHLSTRIYMRIHPDNTHAIRMLDLIHYDSNSAPPGLSPDEHSMYKWYVLPLAKPSRFGSQIRTLRQERGVSQELLGFQCGVTRTTINMIETGRRNPSVDLLQSLCAILGKTEINCITMLLSLIDHPPSPYFYSLTTLTHEDSPRDFSNSYVLAKIKVWMEGKYLWVRTISSTIVGQVIDTSVFVLIGFSGILPASVIIQTIISGYLFKVCYEAAVTPLTYLIVGFLKRREGVDFYDRKTSFTPVRLDIE